jgi:cytochrome c peroxidase
MSASGAFSCKPSHCQATGGGGDLPAPIDHVWQRGLRNPPPVLKPVSDETRSRDGRAADPAEQAEGLVRAGAEWRTPPTLPPPT